MNSVTMKLQADPLILQALQEDITGEDVTTNAILPEDCQGEAELLCKQDGIIAGLDVFARPFTLLDDKVWFEFFVKDGDKVHKGQKLAKVVGSMRAILSAERVGLNYLQRISGIATYTHQVAALLEGTGMTLVDTRKTTPNMRVFEKYAVTVGVLLKDNHISAAGGVAKAIAMAKAYAPFVRKIEVETETLDMVREAVEAGADIIMLDNMSHDMMKEAVALIDGRAETECSGNVTKENIAALADIGVDYISSGALTHSAPILDLSLKHLHRI
jgi:nicotinate-nucleotide pyrophosphorylase (carboxylating)